MTDQKYGVNLPIGRVGDCANRGSRARDQDVLSDEQGIRPRLRQPGGFGRKLLQRRARYRREGGFDLGVVEEVSGVFMPGGNPDLLEQLAAHLEAIAEGTGDLGASSRQVTASIRSEAAWTGDAADA